MADAGTAGLGVAVAIGNAIKASGAIVNVEPEAFTGILRKIDKPLIVYTQRGLFSTNHQYMTSYKGFIFYTKSRAQIDLPKGVEVITAKKIWIPG